MTYNSTHFSTESGGDFKAFVDHFRTQAEGTENPTLFSNKSSLTSFKNNRARRSNLVLVNLKKKYGTSKNGAPTTGVEIIDPEEGARKRAMAEIVREEINTTNDSNQYEKPQSALGKRKRKTPTNPRKRVSKTVADKVKRVRDIFD